MDAVNPNLMRHALRQEYHWLQGGSAARGPAHLHALNLQGMIFRLRMSNDVCFYAEAWRRICSNKALWRQVEILVHDAFDDWKAGRAPMATVGLRTPAPTKQEERVRNEYFSEFYETKKVDLDDQRRRRSSVALPNEARSADDFEEGRLPLADERRRAWFWALIQLSPHTIVASRRVTEAWTKAAGIRLGSEVFYAADSDEDQYFEDLSRLLISRTIPMRWFTMIAQSQRDALLTKRSQCRMPLAPWSDWSAAASSFMDPERPLGTIIDEAVRALVDAGYPAQATDVIDAYLPGLQADSQDLPHLYQNRFLAYTDLGKPKLALRAADAFQQAAKRDADADLGLVADLCVMALKVQRSSNPRVAFQEHWVKLLPKARAAQSLRSRIWRLTCLSVECDRAGQPKEAEKALLLAQRAADGDYGLVQMVLEHDRIRDRHGGAAHTKAPPPAQPGLLGTPGFASASYDALVEHYYESYPEERPD